ncbi:MAG: DUF1566 domain-containing protein [Gelidibacter sp.]|nr:DUF1566 domain-containing protein [Gelidibacter sp.]
MKKIFTLLIAVLLSANVFAQSPDRMSYQAVIRDASNNLVISQNVGMQISILQTSTNGTAVFVERHFPTTNVNGLVSIEIGDGLLVSGDFTTIDWTNGPYFISTETDLNGGANYTITGTSQLLSVPYALHAKTADAISGDIIETDPIYDASAASGITTTDIANWDDKQDELTAGTGIDITNNVISTTNGVTTYSIGDFAHGGIVFWVDDSGQHGLVCAKEDQNTTGTTWNAGANVRTQARGDGPFAGETNTSIIIAVHAAISDNGSIYAARICNELQVTEGGKTYGDWYLPSIEELSLMYQNWAAINATAIANEGSYIAYAYYWSSTESSNTHARRFNFNDGLQFNSDKSNNCRVRAVRAF